MLRFTIRELLLLTLVVALGVGWWLNRSMLAWRYDREVAAADWLRDPLDVADPDWRTENDGDLLAAGIDERRAKPFYAAGIALFAVAVLVVFLVWQRRLHVSILNDRPRF
jgi:hypothetical protein